LIVLDRKSNSSSLSGAFAGLSAPALERFASQAQRAAGLRGEVHILITSSRTLRALNRRFRRKDKATDVLSFPAVLDGAAGGDIAISVEIAAQQARAMGHSVAQELKILMLHGMLHLAGYDHESDDGEMACKEERLRQALGLKSALIRRTGSAKKSSSDERSMDARRKCWR
jgi:probable rRNA maturation factor